MAKGSAMGLWKGKKGSAVFYKIKNSNSAQKQGIRERVYEVSNPKSAAQAAQRMKLLPAQRIATLLKRVIERGFEGVEYGAKSRAVFMKYALAMTEGVPATDKDSSIVYPGKYLIAKGQLPEVFTELSMSGGDPIVTVGLAATRGESTLATVGSLSASLLENNKFLQAGDQITFVLCDGLDASSIEDSKPRWRVVSIFLDTEDARTMAEAGLSGLSIATSRYLQFGVTEDTYLDGYMAAACIISRDPEGQGHLRSNATIDIAPVMEDFLFGPTAIARARATYMSSSDINNDWPVQTEDSVNGVVGTIDGLYELSGLTGAKAVLNGQSVKVKYNAETGELAAYYYKVASNSAKCPVTNSGFILSYEDSGNDVNLTVADVAAFSGLKAVLFTAGA